MLPRKEIASKNAYGSLVRPPSSSRESQQMVRKRRDITETDVQNWVKKGFGQGEGDAYSPWAKVRDVPSLGRSTRIAALRHKRIHNTYSDVETGHLLQTDFALGVIEIREQFALLPREETVEIAEELGLRHPTYPGTRVPIVMTSDLFVLRGEPSGGPFVLSVKRDEALHPGMKGLPRTLEKLQIEKRYWDCRNIPWRLVTQSHFDPVQVRNLALLRPSGKAWRSAEGQSRAADVAQRVASAKWRMRPLRALIESSGWGAQAMFEALGHAAWRRWLPLDMSCPLSMDCPLPLLGVRDAV
ncbi:TnsA endonuclease N-terminal domain-containing protein [Thermomonas fusca]|uniref:TnsA endonuclease N-terminal domain-containing protein n=1 Tax=Thermomonas fusca TaxID=215690 RepID=UPI00146F7A65|nr:TnsA endonuclease N-terminal domain-containing protein [Thermomonas fusca]